MLLVACNVVHGTMHRSCMSLGDGHTFHRRYYYTYSNVAIQYAPPIYEHACSHIVCMHVLIEGTGPHGIMQTCLCSS